VTRARRRALLSLSILAGSGASPAAEPAAFRDTARQLECATFLDHSAGRLEAETGARRRRETLSRDGVLRFRARPAGNGVVTEAWYDSVAVSRTSPEATLIPDTEGLIGGRYRGLLSPSGRYQPSARPFVPDPVAEVTDLGATLDDLLPPLPPVALAVGQSWNDGAGLELRRLPDSMAQGRSLLRLALRARAESHEATIRGDTTGLKAVQVTTEQGEVDWDASLGLVRRVRHIVVETSVPAGGPLKLPLRSRLEQDATLLRGRPHCSASAP
jgi:hypothetical protein